MSDMESVGNETSAVNRIEALRDDLRVDVKKLTPTKGDLLIVSPRNPRYIFTQQYAAFLGDALTKCSNGAAVIIALDQLSKINNIKPPTQDEVYKFLDNYAETETYLMGWKAAMETVTKVLSNVDETV